MKKLMVKSKNGAPFEVKGHLVGTNFFAHRDVRQNNRWRITHVATCCTCDGQRYALRKRDAIEAAEKMGALDVPGWYWDFSDFDEFPEVDISKVLKEVLFFSGFRLPNNRHGCPLLPLFNYQLTRSRTVRGATSKGQRPKTKTKTLRVKGKGGQPIDVAGYYVGTHFFVHRDLTEKKYWRIIHVKTRHPVDCNYIIESKRCAVEVVEKLEALDVPGWYWDFETVDEMPVGSLRAGERIRNILFEACYERG